MSTKKEQKQNNIGERDGDWHGKCVHQHNIIIMAPNKNNHNHKNCLDGTRLRPNWNTFFLSLFLWPMLSHHVGVHTPHNFDTRPIHTHKVLIPNMYEYSEAGISHTHPHLQSYNRIFSADLVHFFSILLVPVVFFVYRWCCWHTHIRKNIYYC